MLVEVIEHLREGRLRVRSPYGSFSAQWRGTPPTDSAQFVEIDVDAEVVWGEDLTVGDVPVQEIVDDGDNVRISGYVESLTPDGTLSLGLDGASVMLDTRGQPPARFTGRYATVLAGKVALSPYDL